MARGYQCDRCKSFFVSAVPIVVKSDKSLMNGLPNQCDLCDSCHDGLVRYLSYGREPVSNESNCVRPSPRSLWETVTVTCNDHDTFTGAKEDSNA